MPEDMSKDVVGARINLDTSKIANAFKVINQGVQSNVESFKSLNAEITTAEKSYSSLARAMDKIVLSADERRKKILDESNALVAQRTAQAELLKAKKAQLDATNQIVESKLKSQLAIQKKRHDAIEQQEREHQQRMATLQQKTMAASTQENIMQARLDREFLMQKRLHQKIEQEAERHTRQMSRFNGGSDYSIFSRSSQYFLAGTFYYNAVRGAQEAIQVLKDFEYNLVNIQRVMGDTADIELVKKSMIADAKEYGYALKEVGDVYTLIGQQGFNERETAALARTAFMAANVEQSFRDAAQAQELMTGAILNYNMAAEDSMRLLDMLNEVSNNFATDSKKLLEGINRTGAAAKNAGVPIEKLIGYLTVLNQAGFTGSVAGNAIKSFISFSSRDIAIDKLEKYVGTIKQATGEMMPFAELLDRIAEKWYQLSDAERHEITQAVARGDQASRFIALMDNYSKVIEVATTAENSFGSAQRENALAMSTLAKQSQQLKAEWDALIVSMGDAGFLGILKAIVSEMRLLVEGFNSLPEPIRNTLMVTLALGTAITVLNTGVRLLTGTSLIAMVTQLANVTRSIYATSGAVGVLNAGLTLLQRHPVVAALSILATVLGTVTIAWSHFKGATNAARDEMDRTERDAYALAQRYKELKDIVDDNTRSDEEITQAKQELATVMDKISSLMPNLVSQWDEHGRAIQLNIDKLSEFSSKYKEELIEIEQTNIRSLEKRKEQLENQIESLKGLREDAQDAASNSGLFFMFSEENLRIQGEAIKRMVTNPFVSVKDVVKSVQTDSLAQEIISKGEELARIEQQLKNSQETLDMLAGRTTTQTGREKQHGGRQPTEEELAEEYRQRREDFQARMAEFRHLVNVEAEGYRTASEQLKKLQAIRKEFSDLEAPDLYGIDEDIYRLSKGMKIQAKEMKEESTKAFVFPLDVIDRQKLMAEQLVNDIQAMVDMFSAKEFSLADSVDTVNEKVGLYTQHQKALHEANNILRASLDALAAKQEQLNRLFETGKITSDEYNKASEDVENRIKSITDAVNRNSIAWWNDARAIKEAKEQQLRDSFEASEQWIAHQKAIGELSAREEYEAWVRVQNRYLKGTELRKQADERVYAAKQRLLQEEERAIDELLKKQKKSIQEAKEAELDRIKAERDAFVKAQDEKINAIDKLLAAQQQANEDADYEAELAEKMARRKLLESAVGPEGIRERRELDKEIARMQEERQRELQRRSLEAQKEALEEEKRQRLEDFDRQIEDMETHYNNLLSAFDNFTNDIEGRAETLKQIQIAKESEKNAEILRQLDVFIAEYKAKMSMIAHLSRSQEEIDLEEYNRNKDLWEAAKARGDTAEMARLQQRNEELRRKYGITQDTGKLQHFKDGGIVKGVRGQPVQVVAHAGEMYLNPAQQSNLFRLLDFVVPKLNFSMPSFAMASGMSSNVTNNYYYTISTGDVSIEDSETAQTFWNERDSLVRRFQARTGAKQR